MKRWLVRSALAALGLFVIQAVVGALLRFGGSPPGAGGFAAILGADLLTAAVLTAVASRLRPDAAWRWLLLFGVPCAISFNNLAEAVLFSLDIPREEYPRLFLNSALTTALFGALVAWLVPGRPATPRSAPGLGWGWLARRIVLLDLAYPVFYFAAGMIAWPWLAAFYQARSMPAPGLVLAAQFPRALVFVALAWWMVRSIASSRREAALLTGLVFSVIGGVAPLLVPNPYMPASIRMVHLVEVGVSNLLYGALCGWVLAGAAAPRRATEIPAAA
jgi:hypothetical protein